MTDQTVDERLARIEQALYHFADDYARRMATLGQLHAESMYEDVRSFIEPGFKQDHGGLDMTGFSREDLKRLLRQFHPAYTPAASIKPHSATTYHKTVEHVARHLDLDWRRTCGYEPDTDHEVTWSSFRKQAEVAIAATKELPHD